MGLIIFIAVDVVILCGLIAAIYYCYTRFYKSNKVTHVSDRNTDIQHIMNEKENPPTDR